MKQQAIRQQTPQQTQSNFTARNRLNRTPPLANNYSIPAPSFDYADNDLPQTTQRGRNETVDVSV